MCAVVARHCPHTPSQENRGNAVTGGHVAATRAKFGAVASAPTVAQRAEVPRGSDESFQLNFTTFIDDKAVVDAEDASLSPASFNVSFLTRRVMRTAHRHTRQLSDLSPSASDSPNADTTGAVAGVTATTFVLENNFRKVRASCASCAREQSQLTTPAGCGTGHARDARQGSARA